MSSSGPKRSRSAPPCIASPSPDFTSVWRRSAQSKTQWCSDGPLESLPTDCVAAPLRPIRNRLQGSRAVASLPGRSSRVGPNGTGLVCCVSLEFQPSELGGRVHTSKSFCLRPIECAQKCAQTRSNKRHPATNANHELNKNGPEIVNFTPVL